jgi:hypothetical protein
MSKGITFVLRVRVLLLIDNGVAHASRCGRKLRVSRLVTVGEYRNPFALTSVKAGDGPHGAAHPTPPKRCPLLHRMQPHANTPKSL